MFGKNKKLQEAEPQEIKVRKAKVKKEKVKKVKVKKVKASKVKAGKEKAAKPEKPVYVPVAGFMGMGEDYHIYKMTFYDRLKGAFAGSLLGAAIGYVFFNNWYVAAVLAAVIIVKIQGPYREHLKKKRLKKLILEFKDLLEALTASYSAGQTTTMAFLDAQKEMADLFGERADIVQELNIINVGLQHNFNIEDLLLNFAQRSGLDDVESFANVFEVCNRKGGNLKQIVGETRSVINDKIEIEMEIQTMVAAGKNDLNIMMVLPFVIMLSMRGLGESMTGNSLVNIIVKIVVLGIFAAAYMFGLKIVEIKL
ncbi:kinase [Clostridium sp. MCC353]|uniref:type II secretion system F family protein n=1 Tax=Clostridium sp. MCC353 TaxID=2592646 RepID=UPI001C03937E|nr:kinase [Clostridium sp. MCC353]MBT9776417.1 kinase [Clostridium sp. MCC353]